MAYPTKQKEKQIYLSEEAYLAFEETSNIKHEHVILSCDTSDNAESHTEKPCFIAEVLSKSTARTDKGEKWLTYQKIPSLRYYLLVDSLKQNVTYFCRNEEGEWFCATLEESETLTIERETYQTVLTLADIYEDVIF